MKSFQCRRNYIISMTDGYPSVDTDAQRITAAGSNNTYLNFANLEDSDHWTADPNQYWGDPPANYYDDVAKWIYNHSIVDKSVVTDPANSYVNVITHHVAFGAKHPMLQNAASKSGGQFIAANNKDQLIAAFYSLALLMSDAVSFTAPVVSVDAVNKIQSGDDLYMGLFLPQGGTYWSGNVKKFKLGSGPGTPRPDLFMIYDAKDNVAINSSGEFLDNTAAFWGDDNDANDVDTYGAADIKEDGAGEVLLEDVQSYFTQGAAQPDIYYKRPIYTAKLKIVDGKETWEMVKFDPTNILISDLNVADDSTRRKLINFIHGYTYAADVNGYPVAVRDWILGAIIHSRPVVLDYFNTSSPTLPLLKRLIAVGSNDGMLHVFDDNTGREVFAFIPPDILPSLKEVQINKMYDTVDGLITLYRRNKNPKYLMFGERRGGKYYWSIDISVDLADLISTGIDPTKWTVKWGYTNDEIKQSWSEVKVASIPWNITTEGEKSYKDVAIITGGYDDLEDNFPEPFTDKNSNGTWDSGEQYQNVVEGTANTYDKFNPGMDTKGRGFFVVDIDDPTNVTTVNLSTGTSVQVLPFSATWGSPLSQTGVEQKFPEMQYAVPASPSVVSGTDKYFYKTASGLTPGYKENVLFSIYATDIYANIFKARFNLDVRNNGTTTNPDWRMNSANWTVNKVFSANPGSTSGSGNMGGQTDPMNINDQGRKAFYPPAVSWGGTKGYFEAGNYYFPNADGTFGNMGTMASLFFGTGDREHPKYTTIRNRFYAIYDDSSVTATRNTGESMEVSSAPYKENNLLNLTCDELGDNTTIISGYTKTQLRTILKDDAVYIDNSSKPAVEGGSTHENDAKGWYIVLEDQGKKTTVCSHVTYPTTVDASTTNAHDNHIGEQMLSQAILYYGTLYFTTYQPTASDPCNPVGNGFAYSLDYRDGSSVYNLNATTQNTQDITDRYKKFTDIFGIPSGFTIVLREGHAAAMASMGGAIVGPGPDPLNPYEIDTPGLGLELFYWRDSNSQQ